MNANDPEMRLRFPELILADAMLHLALRRKPESDQGDALALFLLRNKYQEVKVQAETHIYRGRSGPHCEW